METSDVPPAANDNVATPEAANDNVGQSTAVEAAQCEPPTAKHGPPAEGGIAGNDASDGRDALKEQDAASEGKDKAEVDDSTGDDATALAVFAAEAEPPIESSSAPGADDEPPSRLEQPKAANDDVSGRLWKPEDGVPVIGRGWDTGVAKDSAGYAVINQEANPNANEYWQEAYERGDINPDGWAVREPGWSAQNNEAWIQSIIDQRSPVYLASNPEGGNLWNGKDAAIAVFADEVNQLKTAGYTREGDYLVPPPL